MTTLPWKGASRSLLACGIVWLGLTLGERANAADQPIVKIINGQHVQFWIYAPSIFITNGLPTNAMRFEFTHDLKQWGNVGNETTYSSGWRMTEISLKGYTNEFLVRFHQYHL